MRTDIIDTLASVLWEQEPAIAVVKRSGFPVGRVPAFRGGATVFWMDVVGVVENGAPPGLERLLETAWKATENPAIYALLQGGDQRVEQISSLVARLVYDSTEAYQMARSAGFPVTEIPNFKSAGTFWTTIVTAMCSGVSPVERLLHVLRLRCPYNQEVITLHEDVKRNPIRPAKPARMTLDAALARVSVGVQDNAVALLCETIAEARKAAARGDLDEVCRILEG
jgi:hypothetical protein